MKNNFFLILALAFACSAMTARERVNFDKDWKFALGNAASPADDYLCGTEYFTYLSKANSIHNEGPYSHKFNAYGWRNIDLPHDWVPDLPYDSVASHSHGYHMVGWQYPGNSVGWYRKTFTMPEEWLGKHVEVQFDGIFRDSKVWCNGFYMGGEPSGYAQQTYDITDYLNPDGENLICVRADASTEEGWYYEGAGIYRHVWIDVKDPLHIPANGTFVYADIPADLSTANVNIETEVANASPVAKGFILKHTLLAPDGTVAGNVATSPANLRPRQTDKLETAINVTDPQLWSTDNPQLYTLVTEVIDENGDVTDRTSTRTGLRRVEFTPDSGLLLNNQRVKLRGVNMHQDHTGVGAGIPDALQLYRLRLLKEYGVNAYRSSHNPATPEVLDMCDSLGILVIDENRLTGINDYHKRLLDNMIRRDRNHPSVILWSVGNEEWGIEWNDYGSRIVETMRDYCHLMDPSRQITVASSSGPTVLVPADVAGYNYILQNPVEKHRADYPQRCAVGTEETTGCGTRGIYYDDYANGRMAALNRAPNGPDSIYNCIERGWKFYDERPWLGGLFYWTGLDHKGESNPMVYPATIAQKGILDYCGFPKDEAYYIQSWWTDIPTLHIFPHWNLHGHEGEEVSVWAYSNLDEVELIVNGRNLGRQAVPRNGHLEWTAVYQPGKIKARGYRNGRRVMESVIETTGAPASLVLSPDRTDINADGTDLTVCNVQVNDNRGRRVPDACIPLEITVSGPVRIIGAGNGDTAFRDAERPADRDARTFTIDSFNGLAQVLVQSDGNPGAATVTVSSPGCNPSTVNINLR